LAVGIGEGARGHGAGSAPAAVLDGHLVEYWAGGEVSETMLKGVLNAGEAEMILAARVGMVQKRTVAGIFHDPPQCKPPEVRGPIEVIGHRGSRT
jgi:hypothetical protein